MSDVCELCGRSSAADARRECTRPDDCTDSISREPVVFAYVSVPEGGDEDGDICICEKCYRLPHLLVARGCDLYELHYEFGLCYSEEDRREDAAECFERALAVERRPDALTMLAVCRSKPEEQERLLREALKLDPENSLALCNLRQVLGLNDQMNGGQEPLEPRVVEPLTFPILEGDTSDFPSDRPVCPICGRRRVWEPHSMACLNVGAMQAEHVQDGGKSLEGMLGYLDLSWHGAHDGGEGEDRDIGVELPIVKDVRGGQAALYFCSTQCLRQFFNSCVDELERRIASERSGA